MVALNSSYSMSLSPLVYNHPDIKHLIIEIYIDGWSEIDPDGSVYIYTDTSFNESPIEIMSWTSDEYAEEDDGAAAYAAFNALDICRRLGASALIEILGRDNIQKRFEAQKKVFQ